MVFIDYTNLLNLTTWFNEATIQSRLSKIYGGNIGSIDIFEKTTTPILEELRTELSLNYEYFFNKPDVNSGSIYPIKRDDLIITAVWPGIQKEKINIVGTDSKLGFSSLEIFNLWKIRGWKTQESNGIYYNSFRVHEGPGDDLSESPYIGISVSMSNIIIVLLIKTCEDNSVEPGFYPTPIPPPPPSCTDGLDISIYDEEEELDDCGINLICETNYRPAN